MKWVRALPERCKRCALCPPLRACDAKAMFRVDSDDAPSVEMAWCTGCMRCVDECPEGALRPFTA